MRAGSLHPSSVLLAPGATVGFNASTLTAVRKATRSAAFFTVTRTGSAHTLNKPTTVHFNVSSNGSAVEGVDFVLPQRSVTFIPSTTSVVGVVIILEHSGVEFTPKSFQIGITAVENGTLGADGHLLTVVIVSSQCKLSEGHVVKEPSATQHDCLVPHCS